MVRKIPHKIILPKILDDIFKEIIDQCCIVVDDYQNANATTPLEIIKLGKLIKKYEDMLP